MIRTIQVYEIDESWDRFVSGHPDGTIFHQAVWRRIVERAFGHRPYYLAATEEGGIRGVLPLFEVKSRLFGHSLVSVPFGVYGGILAADPEAEKALVSAAGDLAARLGVHYAELRHVHANGYNLPTKDLYVTFRRPIDPDPEANFAAIPRKQRRMIRQGEKHGLTAEFENDAVEALYDVYAESVHNLGTPVFPLRWFEIIREEMGEACRILLVRREGRVEAGVMVFYDRDVVMPYYGGARKDAFQYAVNDFMYWELLRRSAEEGRGVFDFGRSKKESGSYHFKRHWGFEPEDLAYQYILGPGKEMPNVSPNNPKYRLFIETWKRLPVPVAKWLGPRIVRNIP